MSCAFRYFLLSTVFVLAGCAQKIIDKDPRYGFESSAKVTDLAACIGDRWEKRKYGTLENSLSINQRNIKNGLAVTGMNDWSEFIQVRITNNNTEKSRIAYKAISTPIENIYLQDVIDCL